MKSSHNRCCRRRSGSARSERAMFKKEGQQEQGFFDEPSPGMFFQAAAGKVQKKEAGTATTPGNGAGSYISTLNGKGHALSPKDNHFFSSKMGYDFSDVKVHTDKEAAESAKGINARAYTIGNNIVFNEGQYNTGSGEGKNLMAHELVHVMQQNGEKGNELRKKVFRTVNIQSPYDKTDDFEPSVQYRKQSIALGHTDPVLNGKTQKNPSEKDAADFFRDSMAKPVFSERNLDDIARPDLSDSSLDPVRANWVELEKGSPRVRAVKLVQEAIEAWGRGLEDPVELLPVWGPDGNFKKETKAAVEFFQSKHPGLVVDGVVGDKTLGELQKEMDNLHGRIFTLQSAGVNNFKGLIHTPPAPSKWLNVKTTPGEFDNNKSVLLAHRNMVAIHLMKDCSNVTKLLVTYKADGDVPGSILAHERVHEADQTNTIKNHLVPWDAQVQMAQQLGFKTKAKDENEAAELLYKKFGITTPQELAKRILNEWKAGNQKFHSSPAGTGVSTGLDTPDCQQVVFTFKP